MGEIPGLKSIRVDPPMASVRVEKGTPATVQFKAFGTFDGKPEREITTEVSWRSDDPGRADVDQKGLATTAPNVGGLATITATSGFIRGQAKLTIKYSEVMLDTTVTMPVPAEAPTKFTAAPMDAARAPVLVYPASGVLLPPNLAGIEIHFTPTVETNKLFELQFTSPYLDLRVYTRCQAPAGVTGCIYTPSQDAWKVLAAANRGGGDVQVVVRGMDEAGTGKGESAAITVGFSRDEILGAVYYWSTKEKAVKRWDFGSTKQKTAETVVEGSTFGGTCPGCHALARDGGKLVLSTNGQNDGRLLLFDLKTNKALVPYPLAQRSQFEAWNPSGSQFVGIFGDETDVKKNPGYGSLMFFDGTTGAVQSMVKPTPYLPDHPDWSPDGNRIVFTTVGQHKTDQQSYKGGLAYVTVEGAGWSAAKELLPPVAGKNRYYPAISPTNDFIAFNESTCPAGKEVDGDCDFDMDTTSKLWGLFLQGTATPVEFVNANKPGVADGAKTAITNSYPKWSPFVFQLTEERKLLWMTFTSRRAYGLRGSKVLLWMVGIEPAALSAGKDPSFTAFALPFQELESANHIGQWTSKIPSSE
ncbi:MAG: Ig-like domain-containing protein [Deltaproteobacteria bacterium]|nr:Ig-like domain-containing protein [Deltaproteobacteria bacterium]